MSDFTPLEDAVLASICARYPDIKPALKGQLATARVTKRENSGAGFFTTLEVDGSTHPIHPEYRRSDDAEIVGLVHGMGFVLFFDPTGHANLLEGFTYGEPDSTTDLDLANVQFRMKP